MKDELPNVGAAVRMGILRELAEAQGRLYSDLKRNPRLTALMSADELAEALQMLTESRKALPVPVVIRDHFDLRFERANPEQSRTLNDVLDLTILQLVDGPPAGLGGEVRGWFDRNRPEKPTSLRLSHLFSPGCLGGLFERGTLWKAIERLLVRGAIGVKPAADGDLFLCAASGKAGS